jgi:hypothetical protein
MMQDEDGWEIAHASVRGKSHVDGGIPNQDALFINFSNDRRNFVVAVSDGAGSASLAEKGAAHFSSFIGQGLLSLVELVHAGEIDGKSMDRINDRILGIIISARCKLALDQFKLRDYAANLMAIAMGPDWGIRVHLGDAILLKSRFAENHEGKLDYFADALMTQQDRSEYANETHFLTQNDWHRHLSWSFLDPGGSEDLYALMTDGAGDIALDHRPGGIDQMVFRAFMAPVVNMVLKANPGERNAIIENALADPQTFRLTGDDKTLALILRSRCFNKYSEAEPLIEETQIPPSTDDARSDKPTKAASDVNASAARTSVNCASDASDSTARFVASSFPDPAQSITPANPPMRVTRAGGRSTYAKKKEK